MRVYRHHQVPSITITNLETQHNNTQLDLSFNESSEDSYYNNTLFTEIIPYIEQAEEEFNSSDSYSTNGAVEEGLSRRILL